MDIFTIQLLARFDLMAKYLYLKNKNYNTNFYKELYHKHIITFNNCWEHPGIKTCIEDFFNEYNQLIDNIKKNGYDENFPIPIGNNNVIINGAHRLITSYYFKKTPVFIRKNEPGNMGYDSKFFLNRQPNPPLLRIYTDTMALESIRLIKNMRCMVLFPTATSRKKEKDIETFIEQYGVLYYDKNINLKVEGINNLIKELYREEEWIGGMFPKGFSPGGKAQRCIIDDKEQNVKIYLFYMRDLNKLVELKEKCRMIYGIGKHSLHISDFTKDTFRIASSLLNENSIHFLNNGTNDISENTKKLLIDYFNKLDENNENYCLTSSLIMEIFGLRTAKDIDYLQKDNINLNLKDVGIHDGIWEKYYGIHKDEIIYNPNHYFYFNGFKFTTLDIIKKMKINRGEPKDLQDIKIINNTKWYNVIFICNWANTSEELLNKYKLMTKNNSSIWGNLRGVTDLNIADIVVFLEGIPQNIDFNLLKNKTIFCFPREPLLMKNWEMYNIKHGYTYNNFIHVVTNPQFIDKDYNYLSNLEYISHEKPFSAIISNKNNSEGYKLRRNLLINMSRKYPNLCDIYGAGWKDELGISYKGELGNYHKNTNSNTTKYDGLINYKYSLCIENCSIPNYFTEKITDTMLCWTIPIYYGCTNISEYFPEYSYYCVDITKSDCLKKIKEIVERPITDININALTEARNLILNKYNIWNVIKDKI